MYRIALNVAISFAHRARHRRMQSRSLDETLAEPRANPAEASERADQVAALHAFIDRLDDLNRALLLLYLEEHSYREIADVWYQRNQRSDEDQPAEAADQEGHHSNAFS